MKITNILCEQKKDDCFAFSAGYCMILTDTLFNGPCPFYKTPDTLEGERIKAITRLRKINKEME